jgi:hypothetical protein
MIMSKQRVIVDVDARGRVSLARFGVKSTQLVVDSLPDGGLVLHEAVALTPAEAAHYRDPTAVAALELGLSDAEAGRIRKGNLRSDRKEDTPVE